MNNMYELNKVPVCGVPESYPAPVNQTPTTTFLTTHLPLAVETLTKSTKHADATVSRRTFGPNDCVVMTTWLEKFTYSTVKSTATGLPVVSDSVVIPQEFLQSACYRQESPIPENQFTQTSSSDACVSQSLSSGCPPSNETTCPSSDNSQNLENMLVEMSGRSEDEMCTDSEDEMCTDSEDETSDGLVYFC